MAKERIKSDFTEVQKQAMAIPEIKEYLESLPVMIGDIFLAERWKLELSQNDFAKLKGTNKHVIFRTEAGF